METNITLANYPKRVLFIHVFLIIFFLSPLKGQDTGLAQEIASYDDKMGVWWLGHNSWVIKSDGLVISTDLILEESYRIKPLPITAEEIAPILDISFVTHGHGDHFNQYTSRILIEKSNCMFVLPESCLETAHSIGIPEERITISRPREPFDIKGINVQPLRALHGNENFAIYYEANMQDCGYYLSFNGITLLQPGDTYLLEDHLFLKHVDVLFFSPTEHNMYIDRSVFLINALEPDYIFPQHHGTIKYDEKSRFWAKGYPAEVKIRLVKELQNRYYILQPGDRVDIISDSK